MGLNLLGRGVNSSDKTFYRRQFSRDKNAESKRIDQERRYMSLDDNQEKVVVKFLKEGNHKEKSTINEVIIKNTSYRGNNTSLALLNQIILLERAIVHNIQFAQCLNTKPIENCKQIEFLRDGNNYKIYHASHNFIDGHPMYLKMAVMSIIQDNDYSNLAILRKLIMEAGHINNFPDYDKHKNLLEQLTQYTAQQISLMTNNPHYFDALYAKYSTVANLNKNQNELTK